MKNVACIIEQSRYVFNRAWMVSIFLVFVLSCGGSDTSEITTSENLPVNQNAAVNPDNTTPEFNSQPETSGSASDYQAQWNQKPNQQDIPVNDPRMNSAPQFQNNQSAPEAAVWQNQNQHQNQQPQSTRVAIIDRGLQMETGSYTLPGGWNITQDVAYDPNTGRQLRHNVDIFGPRGELIRGFPMGEYGQFYGQSFEQSWKQPVLLSVGQQMKDFSFGEMRHSPRLQNSKSFRELTAEAVVYGMNLQALEVPFRGIFNGRDYRGVVYLVNISSREMQGMGMVAFTVVTSPVEIFQQTLDINDRINEMYQQNPGHKQRVSELIQRNTQQNMANNQASFEAHQQRMATMRQGFDAQNEQWSKNFFGSGWGTSSSGSDYSSHNAYIDALTGHSTFDDPATGFQVRKEGHYQYNYTDGLGNYYGTDDPSFNPSSLQGNWQKIDPLRPNN